MAILKSIIKKRSFNSTPVSIGVALPLGEENVLNPKGGTLSIKEQSKTNLINLLLTQPGERLYDPNFGVGIKSVLFEPMIDDSSLKDRISFQIDRYIPEIKLDNLAINIFENEHKMNIIISYKIISDNSIDTIQLNFDSEASEPLGLPI